MKGLLRICLFSTVLLMANQATADITTMTFEEFLGWDTFPIGTFYSGIKFEASSTGQDWIATDITTTTVAYDASSWPSGDIWGYDGEYWVHDYVCAWTGEFGSDGKISFDNQDATFVEMEYCAENSTLFLDAYDASGTLLLDSDSGPSNLRFVNSNPNGPGTLRVDWNGTDHIAYVLIHDSYGLWIVDNISTDASGITPEPASAMILGLGSIFFALRRRRR